MIYDHPEDLYNSFNVLYFYTLLRKQGCFPMRSNIMIKKREIQELLGVVNK